VPVGVGVSAGTVRARTYRWVHGRAMPAPVAVYRDFPIVAVASGVLAVTQSESQATRPLALYY
jgi:hypothetical protein